jgi:hypothetical protein
VLSQIKPQAPVSSSLLQVRTGSISSLAKGAKPTLIESLNRPPGEEGGLRISLERAFPHVKRVAGIVPTSISGTATDLCRLL